MYHRALWLLPWQRCVTGATAPVMSLAVNPSDCDSTNAEHTCRASGCIARKQRQPHYSLQRLHCCDKHPSPTNWTRPYFKPPRARQYTSVNVQHDQRSDLQATSCTRLSTLSALARSSRSASVQDSLPEVMAHASSVGNSLNVFKSTVGRGAIGRGAIGRGTIDRSTVG
jgi:hypothetical protein